MFGYLRDAGSYERSNMVMKAGWTTITGSSDAARNVTKVRIAKLSDRF
ncbi:MAG: hypothetical protein P8Z76_18710 [Alphaproteobacteria bacterium]